ncbi:MAG TPA: winged helix-turn-helix domain-containing protein [Bacillales bacterium]|nr:winged helix-turn-helix domain-containing protein [Bacillales bacterium]
MNEKIVLCTDDAYLSATVSKLFGLFGKVRVLQLDHLSRHKRFLRNCDRLIIGVFAPKEKHWALCRTLMSERMPPVFLMLRKSPTSEEQQLAKEIGIAAILLEPFSIVRNMVKDQDELFSLLTAPSSSVSNEEMISLGNGTYFHKKEFWVGSNEDKSYLSDHESDLLLLFIENEGEIVRTEEIAEEIWNGSIEMNSVRKSIKRLREKLGPAHTVIKGRRQGGYIFKREQR